MDRMLNNKIAAITLDLVGAMNPMENRLDSCTQTEVEERRRQNDDMTHKMTEVMERLQKLEANGNAVDLNRAEVDLEAPPRSSIAKFSFETTRVANMALFRMAANPSGGWWCGLERDPEIAAKRRRLKRYGDRARKEFKVETQVAMPQARSASTTSPSCA